MSQLPRGVNRGTTRQLPAASRRPVVRLLDMLVVTAILSLLGWGIVTDKRVGHIALGPPIPAARGAGSEDDDETEK
jgi:hypothetical protein